MWLLDYIRFIGVREDSVFAFHQLLVRSFIILKHFQKRSPRSQENAETDPFFLETLMSQLLTRLLPVDNCSQQLRLAAKFLWFQ